MKRLTAAGTQHDVLWNGQKTGKRSMSLWAKVRLITMFGLLVGFVSTGLALADTTPTNSPTVASGTNWVNPTNVYGQDTNYATFTGTTGTYLSVRGFGFAIPAGATINGVQATVRGLSSGTTATNRTIRVNLTTDGVAAIGTNKTQALNTTIASFALGTAADLWGTSTLTAANVSASNFGVLIRDNDTTSSGTFSIDYVSLTVTYTLESNKPTITTFTVPVTSSSLTISGITLAASDDIGVTGYLINESATPPAAAAVNLATAPTSYTAAAAGPVTLYAWARDAAGNVNNVYTSRTCTISLTPPNPIMHNSANVGTKYGTWGVAGGLYGEFTCTTCHSTLTSPTDNIKRIKGSIPSTIGPNVNKPVVFNNMTGFGDDSVAHATSTKICEVCHTQTTAHQYNTANAPQNNDLSHANGDCRQCHNHADGFKSSGHLVPLWATAAGHAGCATGIGCHTNTGADLTYPTSGTPVPPPDCRACHAKADPTTAGIGCGSCHGVAGGNGEPVGAASPDKAGSHATHTAAPVSATCVSCHDVGGSGGQADHGKGNRGTNQAIVNLASSFGWSSNTCSSASANGCHANPYVVGGAVATPNWGTTGNGCAACHTGANVITANGPATGSHTTVAGHAVACTQCHAASTTSTTEPSTGHNDGNIDVANVGYATLNKTKGTVGTSCSSASANTCHANPYVVGGAVTTPNWGSTGNGCAACHTGVNAITATGPATGSHTTVNGHAVACINCHATGTTSTTEPSTGHQDGDIDVANVGYATLNKTKGTVGTSCSSASALGCHANPYATSGAVTTPNWGTTGNGCAACHTGVYAITANGPDTGSHFKHAGKACIECHAAGTTAATVPSTGHNDTNIDVVNVGYPADVAKHTAGTGYSSCSNIYCHSDGTKGSAPFTAKSAPVWGGSLNCYGCHGSDRATGVLNNITTGRHKKHIAGTYLYSYGCAVCHAATVAMTNNTSISDPSKHGNVQIDVSFSGIAKTGAANAVYDTTGHAPGAAGTVNQSCQNVYCHSNAQTGGQAGTTYYFRNLTGSKRFDQKTTLSLGCNGCHSTGSTISGKWTLSGAHLAHLSLSVNPQIGKVLACADCHADGGTTYNNRARHANGLINYSGALSGSIARANLKLSTGRCNTVYCHSDGRGTFNNMSTNNWFSGVNLGCNGCHGDAASLTSLSGKHDAHIGKVATGGTYGCVDCHASTASNNTTLTATGKHVNAFKDFSGARAYKTGFANGDCTTSCHTDGKGGTAKRAFNWTGAALDCTGCHGGVGSRAGEPIYVGGNSHVKHVGTSGENATCQNCHADTMNGTVLSASGKHLDKFINVTSGSLKPFGYTDATKTCSNINCHSGGGMFTSNDIQWGAQMPTDCTGCHDNEANPTSLSGAHNAHMNSASTGGSFKCKDCHAPTITNADNRTIYDANIHGNSLINYSGLRAGKAAPAKNITCANIYCHSNGKGTFASIPAWVGGSANCQSCHATAAFSGQYAHTAHLAKAGISCASCHNATTNAADTITGSTHIDGTVNLQEGGVFPAVPGTKAVSFAPVGTTCNNVSCHSPASAGPYVNSATWGVKANCNTCHPKANLSGAHKVHMGTLDLTSSTVYYNMTANRTLPNNDLSGVQHGFGCADCHPMEDANHLNGAIEVDLNRVNVAGLSKLRFLNHSSANYDMDNTKKCSNMYCHSNASRMEEESNVKSNTSLAWTDKFDNYTAASKGGKDRCAWCHGNQPTTGAHVAHAVSNHSDNIYNGKNGKVGFKGTGNSAHGNPATTTTITCYICHAATVNPDAHGNDKNTKCNGCHGVTVPKKGNAYINNLANHVNGSREISFAPIKVRSKAQVRPESFRWYTAVWERSYYKNMTTIAFDISKLPLNTATMWHYSSPRASNCSNLACHNGYKAVWNMQNWNDPNKCMDCHFKL